MLEAPATGLTAAAQIADISAQPRPRVSAASFKDLTARLRKAEVPSISPAVSIPDIIPAPTVQRPIVAIPEPEPVAAAGELAMEVADPQPQIWSPVAPAPVDPEIGLATTALETAADATISSRWPSDDKPLDASQPLEVAVAIEPPRVDEVPIAASGQYAAVDMLLEAELDASPDSARHQNSAIQHKAVEPSEEVWGLEPAAPIEAQPIAPVAMGSDALVLEDAPVAPVTNPTPQTQQVEPLVVADELVAKEDAANAALVELAKDRQHQLELEIIWRMLLATPSTEDRNTYLREAEELMGPQPQPLPATAPEHDLSTIEPASDAELAPGSIVEGEEQGLQPAVLLQDDGASEADSAELARSLLDMMASGTSSGLPQERALAADTLLRLVPRLDTKSLVMLSQRVARMDNPPQMMVARLLRHPNVEVSGPLLEDCSQITDKDLESVIAEQDPARMRMIARRRSLGHAITDSLIASGDPSVLLTLVRNVEAEISQEGFLQLIAAAGANIDLLAPLCTRADMSPPMAFELFWHAPAQLRRFILSRFLTDSETLTKILRITMSTNELEQLPEQQEGSLQHTVVEALERAARGKLEAAADDLAGVLKVDKKTVLRVLKDNPGEPLVVMLKVAGYPRQALPGLLNRFRDPDVGLLDEGRDIDELMSIYETLSFNKARILLTYWDWSQRRTGPYAPLT